jgi:hypothetical protein
LFVIAARGMAAELTLRAMLLFVIPEISYLESRVLLF